jgi:DNA helicase-2/ATP-dependent DNA helicase PcrA
LAIQHSGLEQADLDIIGDEEKILAEVLEALRKEQAKQFSDVGINREAFLQLLKDSGRSSETDLPALLQELQIKSSLENRSRPPALPSADMPYFARMVLREADRTRNLLLGYSTFLSNYSTYPVVDWRNAPAAKMFYRYKQGDEFEQELPSRVSIGKVEIRRILTIYRGKLEQIQTADRILRKRVDGIWIRQEIHGRILSGGERKAVRGVTFGVGTSGSKSAEVSALLDEEQFGLLNEAEHTPLLILGGAGSGKTTVALYRIATLAYRDPARFNEKSMVVIVPDEGLARLSRNLLKVIGMKDVQVATFDQWVHKEGGRIIKGLPVKLCTETPSRVIHLKRHPGMMVAVGLYIGVQAEETRKRISRAFPSAAASLQGAIPEFSQANPVTSWLKGLQTKVEDQFRSLGRETLKGVEEFFKAEQQKLLLIANDRRLLFSDHILLQSGIKGYEHQIDTNFVDELIAHTRSQLSATAADLYRDVDEERKVGIDGQNIAEEEEDVAGTIDVEDYPVLFEILRRKVGRIETPDGSLRQYSHMVLDEAQELSSLELGVLGNALAEPKSISIAGDAAQQTDANSSFASWEEVLKNLGITGVSSAHLTTNYRSPAPISEFAHKILGNIGGPAPKAPKDGVPVLQQAFHSYGEAVVTLIDLLTALMESEPHASVAVILRTEKASKEMFKDLNKVPDTRLIIDGQFPFTAGIDVTHVGDVKGLEFDYVVIPDADAHVYPDDPKSRRALHVACTRAVHQLLVMSTATPSPIVPKI